MDDKEVKENEINKKNNTEEIKENSETKESSENEIEIKENIIMMKRKLHKMMKIKEKEEKKE